MIEASAPHVPAKMMIERRVRPGAEREFRAWTERLVHLAKAHAAHQGTSVINTGDGNTFVILRFSSQDDLDAWSGSTAFRTLLRAGDAYSRLAEDAIVLSGFETWFAIPGRTAAAPPRWKMALVTWSALLPQVIALGIIVPTSVPFVVRAAVTTAIPVAMLTWIIMPRLTALLHSWLYPRAMIAPV